MSLLSILDIRTLMMGYMVSLFICVGVMTIVWQQNRLRFGATSYWLANFVLQLLVLVLIVLRGLIPDFLSIIVSGFFAISGAILLLVGLQRHVGKQSSQQHNFALLLVFVVIHTYFTYAEPSLIARNINYSLFLIVMCGQAAWVMLAGIAPQQRRMGASLVGGVMVAYCLVNAGRLSTHLFIHPGNDFFHTGTSDALMFLFYQVLIVALTFSLVLMVNRQLYIELENDLEQRRKSEAAIRISEGRLARAELAGKSGNWELHLDSRRIVASTGASALYGLDKDRFDYESIKNIPLSEYRSILDTALSKLIHQGEAYDIEFKIRAADTGEIKDIHSIATYDPNSQTVFGVIQDISDRKLIEHELERLAQTDTLTGILNRRHFMLLAEQELSRTARYDGEMSVLMIDIDHFKVVNDTYGHHAGDLVLQELGRVFRQEMREVDFAGRIGGEEFSVVLPQTTMANALEAAERLRRAVEQTKVPLEQGLPIVMTVSIGVASLQDPKTNIDTLLGQADTALYEAKHQGRNRVCSHVAG